MNMISQINAFEDWLEYNELGAGPQLLWYKLLRVANRSGWQSELSIPNTRLQSMTKSTEKTLINHRNQLIQCGLLTYKKRGRTKAGIYILTDLTTGEIPVTNTTTGNIPVVSTVKPTVNTTVVSTVKPTVDVSAYVKQDETKPNEINKQEDDYEGPAELLQRLYGRFPSGMLQGALVKWLAVWPAEMISFAIQLSYEQQKEMDSLAVYIPGILKNWKANNVDTLKKAQEANREFEEKKIAKKNRGYNSYSNYGKPYKTESVTNWDEVAPPVEADPALEAELDRQLAEFYQESDSQ
ncbi:DnaD domain protein [Enterococcus asini]|uniref:DnaD domain protein n=1 Tax=Enterococcus asini TaxID=57732 RepID=UPI00288D469F|nr:DnaD domain protein [Enterococcus asini]MDT2756952.1 DnaD domain protein [Enterococcus asini]